MDGQQATNCQKTSRTELKDCKEIETDILKEMGFWFCFKILSGLRKLFQYPFSIIENTFEWKRRKSDALLFFYRLRRSLSEAHPNKSANFNQ